MNVGQQRKHYGHPLTELQNNTGCDLPNLVKISFSFTLCTICAMLIYLLSTAGSKVVRPSYDDL